MDSVKLNSREVWATLSKQQRKCTCVRKEESAFDVGYFLAALLMRHSNVDS
jgi:hypothetical protein